MSQRRKRGFFRKLVDVIMARGWRAEAFSIRPVETIDAGEWRDALKQETMILYGPRHEDPPPA